MNPSTDDTTASLTDEASGGAADDVSPGDLVGASEASRAPGLRRHLIVLGIAVAGLVIGVVLVISGRQTTSSRAPSTTRVTRGPLLPDLGSVADAKAAAALIGTLDPATLTPRSGQATSKGGSWKPPAGVDLTASGLQRCQQAVAQQNTDRSLGARHTAARLEVGRDAVFVVSYALPASGSSPAGTRIVIVDARTCRVVSAVEP